MKTKIYVTTYLIPIVPTYLIQYYSYTPLFFSTSVNNGFLVKKFENLIYKVSHKFFILALNKHCTNSTI